MKLSFKLWWNKWSEKVLIFFAWHVIPRPIRKWVVIRAFADATTGKGSSRHPDECGYSMVMENMR